MPWPAGLKFYLSLHLIWVALYILLGKGFAYAGYAPIYAGELLLLGGLFALVATQRVLSLCRTPLGAVLLTFLSWQILCTAPYVAEWGTDALRDSVLWAYAAFGWIVAALILRLPGLLASFTERYGLFIRIFAFLGPVTWIASLYFHDSLPQWPNTTVAIPSLKAGEYCVHMAGAFAFLVVGLRRMSPLWLVFIFGAGLLGMNGRGGLLAFLAGCLFVLVLKRSWRHTALLLSTGLLIALIMAVFEIRIATPKESREISLEQLSSSVTSALAGSDNALLEGTRTWRLKWWSNIWSYTVEGEFFWFGKGYGINLADSDGFQVGTRDEPLRSPHSSHVTFLARSGVPGLVLWILLQCVWAGSMLRAHHAARSRNDGAWADLFAWLLAYWLAFMVSAAFDVFLEGPMAGIPFWSLFGLGWGSHALFRLRLRHERESRHPDWEAATI